jgi:hypothetical protein
VREIESTSMPPQRVSLPGGALEFAWQRAQLEPLDAEPLAHFADGQLAATIARRGTGSAVLFAGFASIAASRATTPEGAAALRALLEVERDDDDWTAPGAGLVTRRATTSDGRALTFRLNWTHDRAAFRVAGASRVLVAGDDGVAESRAAAGAEVTVPARSGVLVVQE